MHVQGLVYMLVGAGGNITVQIGDEGVLLVDTGKRGVTDDVLKAIRAVTDKPIRIIINTSSDPDHIGGNEPIAKIGKWLGGNAPGNFGLGVPGARVIAHERALFRMKDLPYRRPAHGDVHHRQGDLLQRRSDPADSPAVRDRRRQHSRVLPPLRRRRVRRRCSRRRRIPRSIARAAAACRASSTR